MPVTKVEHIIKEKGVSVAKRGPGTKVASARLRLRTGERENSSVSSIKGENGADQQQLAKAERTRTLVEQGLKFLAKTESKVVDSILRQLDGTDLPVWFLKGHEFVTDLGSSEGETIIQLDTDTVDEVRPELRGDLVVLYAIELFYLFCRLAGLDEKDSLLNNIGFYEDLHEGEVDSLIKVLSEPKIDNDKIFLQFLKKSANKPKEEKERLVAWLRSRTLIELPYNSERVRSAIQEETDLATLRMRIYNEIKDTYVESVDTANAERIADWCHEKGKRLVGGRFSRAFYIDAMMIASSKVLATKHLQGSIKDLDSLLKRVSFTLRSEALRRRILNFEAVGGEMQRVINLTAVDSVSKAQCRGAVGKFKKALRAFEATAMEAVDNVQAAESPRIVKERRTHKGTSETWEKLSHDREEIKEKIDQVRNAISVVEGAIAEAPKADPAFMAFFQRIFPIDAIYMGVVNELLDPFFGEDEDVHRLIRECGHNLYVTANLRAWLRKCDDWVEALPAYCAYQIVPLKGGRYEIRVWVQRSILEDMYRRHAENWALNIEEVMGLEHAALARDIIVGRMGLKDEVEKIEGELHLGREEAIQEVAKRHHLSREVADLAALIEATYLNLCVAVAKRRQAEGVSRMEALRMVIEDDGSAKNLAASALRAVDEGKATVTDALSRAVKERRLKGRARALGSFALKRRRGLPSVHVLTTLGPGETEINVENWLEESMALFNVSRARGLEERVQGRVEEYRRRLVAIGERLVKELDLEGDLFDIMVDGGLQTDSISNRSQGVLMLIASYPEVATEAAKLALMIEQEEKGKRAPENVEEPAMVLNYLKSHPELEAEAVNKVIRNNNLEKAVETYGQSHNVGRDEAARAVVTATPGYAAEKESIKRSAARQRILESLGLFHEVRPYLRKHLDRTLAVVTARREVIGENKLSHELNDPRFRYDASGPFKKFNLLYTPSRVDLGPEEVHSVRNTPKWVGGLDQEAANAGKSLYNLYNYAGATAVDSPRLAEFLKVGENSFSRGGVFYLSLAAGANIDALGIGDFEFFRDQWNMRGDRIVLPAGETYGGFCVPKEFSLLNALIIAAVSEGTSDEIMDGFGVPKEIRPQVVKDLRKALRMRLDCEDSLEWEIKAADFLSKEHKEYFSVLKHPAYISRLPQLAKTLEKIGVLTVQDEEQRQMRYRLARWVNKKVQGLEEVNRTGPFRKIYLMQQLVNEARRKNPLIVPDHKLIGAMSVSYKEGGRKDGREIPISDVRFSAGSRKMEIYAGTAEHHLLNHIDPEGRELLKEMFKGYKSPADIRVVGTCTGSDILHHIPGSGLDAIKEQVHQKLLEAGLNENVITANCNVYGGDLEKWAGIREMPKNMQRALIKDIGANIHLLVLDQRGVYRTYEEAIQGVDFIDLGIPDPELLDLIDDLPKLVFLMRKGRPNSALVFADGTSGARRRTFSFRYASSKRKVKELFALDDNAVYGALGLGHDTVEKWRQEMIEGRRHAEALLTALVEGRYGEAEAIYSRIVERIASGGRDEEALNEEIAAKGFKVPTKTYRYISDALGRIRRGLPLHKLDFGSWLILGGMYLLNGKMSQDKIAETRKGFEEAVAQVPKSRESDIQHFRKNDIDQIVETFLRPKYVLPPEAEYREIETGIAGSLKAVEEKVSLLERREARRRQARRAGALRVRMQGFASVEKAVTSAVKRRYFEKIRENAENVLGDGRQLVEQESFGRFLGWTKGAFTLLIESLVPEESPLRKTMEEEVKSLFTGGQFDPEIYQGLAASAARMAELAKGDRKVLENIAKSLELLDISLLIEKTYDIDNPQDMMIELARFYDATINSHIFAYIPYHYHKQRGVGYEGYSRQEKFELAERRHRWLYTYCRYLMVSKTKLRELGPEYQEAWLGDADRDIMGLGINVSDRAQRFWFSYARLRDVAVLIHEGFPLPEVFKNLDPKAIRHKQRTNVVIIYPHGNTTVPVALEQAPRLAEAQRINLMLTAFPKIVEDEKHRRKVLHVLDGFTYLSKRDYRAALVASGIEPKEAERKAAAIGPQGVLVMVSFSEPVVAHGIFFHFTHPMRPYIETVEAPLIQPLVWEATTHLKCRLPEMLKGSGIRTAEQFNWYMEKTAQMTEAEAKAEIKQNLLKLSEKYDTLIVKPEKESGGRNVEILPVRREGQVIESNLTELANLVYDLSKSDNVVVQEVLKSYVRRLYTRSFLEDLVDRFIRIGIPVQLDRSPRTPLFSYFRQILVLGKKGFEISHNITVVSTMGVANVGQGGLLYEYRDEIINPKYREDLRREITKASFNTLESQRKYNKEHLREILKDYMAIHPEFADKVSFEVGKDLTGFDNTDIPYEMGDYMSVFQVDENDNLIRMYNEEKGVFLPLYDETGKPTSVQVYDKDGKPVPRVDEEGKPLPIHLFDEEGRRIPLFDENGESISTLVMYKIEANPGAGLWRPHNDQLPPNRKGEGVYTIFQCLGERASMYRETLEGLVQEKRVRRHPAPSTYLPSSQVKQKETETGSLDEALRKAKEELGKSGR